jgi:hypothetical protein
LAAAAIASVWGCGVAAAQAIEDPAPRPMPVVALIGGDALQARVEPAVVRLGPDDADWSDPGLPIDLPITMARAGRRGGAFIAPNSHDSLTCLTQAVYYEARSESLAGQQGVAQVVMNRSHSANYPSAVCDVVYERTGRYGTCQFTFVCDGSMRRLVEPAAWDKAHDVASQALGGFVYAPLKDAMHYHASWMTPYWSSSVARIGEVGGQTFYR